MLAAGQVIAGRYLLASPIGEGAMGAVWRAEDQTLRRQVAIKFLFVRGARDPQSMVDQFLREARIAASVQHRNVIHTVDFGAVNDQPFMVMELLHGESLGDRLERQPPLTSEQLVHIVSLTLRGLSAVHDAGIVHRDLKPQNIFLQRDADAVYPKILDFGISRSLGQKTERPSAVATQEGLIVGTPDYMSPEQARGEASIDKRSDIYSMGVIIYEGLTGQLPFQANTIGELIVQIMTQEPPAMCEVAPDVPKAISDLVAQAMSKDREQRFADARSLRRALLAAVESELPPGRRQAISVPPPELAPRKPGSPVATPIPPPPAPAAAATWGDFEGLNASRIMDGSQPLTPAVSAAPAPPPPKQQRMVARRDDALPALELAEEPRSGREARPAAQKARPAEARPAEDRPRERAAGRKSAAEPAADALDPLYAGVEQAAPDIDYVRAGVSPRAKVAVGIHTQRSESRQAARSSRDRAMSGGSFRPFRGLAGWLLPIAALALAGYVFLKPPARTSQRVPGAAGAVRGDLPSPSLPVSNLLPKGLGSGLGDLHLQVKGRRANPGKAAPHMRDVEF